MSVQTLTEKWAPVLDKEQPGLAPITTHDRKEVTARLLESQQEHMNESLNGVGGMDTWSPILMSMVRRIAPRLIAYDVCGVQTMTGPTGLIFALKARYSTTGQAQQNRFADTEAMGFDEVAAGYSGDGTANSGSSFGATPFVRGFGMATATGESQAWASMGVTIEKTVATAETRQLRADYSQELAEDMRRIHNLSADGELINIITNEIVSEINREVLATIYNAAKIGSQWATTAGTIDLATDADGRWSVEKFKGLYFAIERDANQVAIQTRRGKANKLIVSADVGSALAAAGILDFAPALQAQSNLNVDPSGATYAGRMGRYDVYVDPYAVGDGYCLGYKGADQYDAGIFYCPYVPLQLSRANNSADFSNAIGFKTRYSVVSNPFASLALGANPWYRKSLVTNII